MQPFYWVGCILLISLCRRLHRLQQAGRLRSKQYATTLRRVKNKGPTSLNALAVIHNLSAQGHVYLNELRPMKNISTESAEAFVQGTGARIRGVAKERVCHETCDVSIRIQNWRKAIVVQVTIRKAA